MDYMTTFTNRVAGVIGGIGTLGSWGLAAFHEIAAISVAVVTILVLIPTGIRNWRNLGKSKNEDSEK